MTLRVCTGWSPAGRIAYGNRFLASFNANWPAEVELQVYVEDCGSSGPMVERDLWSIPGAREFADRYRDNPEANGRKVREGWKDSDRRKGYSFRFDAYKFFKQILIPQQASLDLVDGDVLVWLDGDTVTLRPVPVGWVEGLLRDGDVCYLNRQPKHSEIGFWAVRINPRTRQFLAEIALIYTSDEFLQLAQWHSAFIWDTARKAAGLKERHLCRPGSRGHVWPTSPLGVYLRHDKGERKGKGL